MSIRLNKIIKELNIGLQTAVDFLSKKPELGEVKNELAFKLNDAQHEALMAAFKTDKEVRSQAEKIFKKPEKEKKPKQTPAQKEAEKAVTPGEALLNRQAKPLGKIDLGNINGKQAQKETPKTEEKEKPAAPAVEKEQPAPVKEEPKKVEPVKVETPVVEEKPKAEDVKETPVQAPKTEEKKAEAEVKPEAEDAAENKAEVEIFTLKSERKTIARPNVIGTIDLDSINQSTHPKKKSKEERRKEREAKQSEKKKRVRIGKERVDVNDAANQQQGGKNGKNARTTAGKAGNQQQGTGKKKKNKKKGQQPQEVSEEDVARQVKETLARLTSKGSQTKKGAKYRKEKRDAAAQQRGGCTQHRTGEQDTETYRVRDRFRTRHDDGRTSD